MEWEYVEKITEEDVRNVEKKLNFKFPKDFLNCIMLNNGGYPSKRTFELNNSQECIKHLLSFREEDSENIIESNTTLSDDQGVRDTFVAIAIDPFGNDIVYDRNESKIMFYEHEDETLTYICDTWTQFVEMLK